MNSFNKTEAAVFSCRLCFLRAFPFISLNKYKCKDHTCLTIAVKHSTPLYFVVRDSSYATDFKVTLYKNLNINFNFILPKVNTDNIRQAQVLNIDN